MNKINKIHNNGFSLIEVLISVVILALGLALIFTNIIQTRKGAQATLEELKGIGYAEDMISRIKCTPYDKLPKMSKENDESTFSTLKIDDQAEIQKVIPPFQRLLTVVEFEQKFDKKKYKMKKVTVEVQWTISNKNDKNETVTRDVGVTLETILRKLVN